MNWDKESSRLEGLIYGWNFGSHRFELLQLCFPWLHKAEIQLGDQRVAPYAPLICCIEARRGRPVEECGSHAEHQNLGRALTYITHYTFTKYRTEDMNPYGGFCIYYTMFPGVPWPEAKPGENIYIGVDNPCHPYKGGAM